ncbi:MAG: LLM class F420-dependent oxidoreductase [Candidatus Binataceae bacterium]|nr:LLM class F420-dependent oxidoreductase [Candidatus Binataceae bacterium]
MKAGLMQFATEYTIRPDVLAKAAEDRGFESLFIPEHTHIPAARKTPYPGGGELPAEYCHTLDPFVALALAAAATTRLKLATGACLVTEHDPIALAKAIATIDLISGGRFIFGVGAGWNVEELENHGTAFKTRWKLLRERIEALKAIWTQEEASYHGEFVNFDRIWSYPKPVQKPHPPVLLGGHGPLTIQRVVRYGDGWMPLPSRSGDLAQEIASLRRLAAEAGRDPKAIEVSLYWIPPDYELVRKYRELDIERLIFHLPSVGEKETLSLLDKIRLILDKAT